jgi:hypothetical protein
MKRPAFQFYPADWRKDPALSSCSLAARGLWIEMLCVGHESDNYGVLVVNGRPMNEAQIARAVGESPNIVRKLLQELDEAGVFSRDGAGAIYSRRMVKDEYIRAVRAKAGMAGWESKSGKRSRGRFAQADAEANPKQTRDTSGDLPEQTSEQKTAPSSSSSENPPKPPLQLVHPDGALSRAKRIRRRLRATAAPDSLEITEALAAWAVAQGLPEDRIDTETMKMLTHFKGKGEMKSDWTSTWRNWILKAVEYGGQRAAR